MVIHTKGRGPRHISRKTTSVVGTGEVISVLPATPTLALNSAAGAVPITFDVSSTDYTASFYGQIQIATDSGFATITQDIVHTPSGDEWARLDADYGINDPAGTYYARFRFLQDNPTGATTVTDQLGNTFNADASAWSNTITDTISVSSAVLTNTIGTGMSKYLNIVSPFFQFILNAATGAPCLSRATVAAASTKFHGPELTCNGISASAGVVYCGFGDGTIDFNAGSTGFIGTANVPGGTSGANGITARAGNGGSNVTIFCNGTQTTSAFAAAFAVGDALIWEVDRTAHTFALYHWQASAPSSTPFHVVTKTLTSQIPPSALYAFAGGNKGNGTVAASDSGTLNFGASSFKMTPNTGFEAFYA